MLSMVYVRGLATGADCAEFRDVLAMSRKLLWCTDIYCWMALLDIVLLSTYPYSTEYIS